MSEIAKDAWDINLEVTYDGTKILKKKFKKKIQMLSFRFEEIRMKDDQTFDDFYAHLNDIVNSSFNL